MQADIVVTYTGAPPKRGTASDFESGTVLKCVSAPSGYLYAIGFVAIKAMRSFDVDSVLQYDGYYFRAYDDQDLFFKQAKFEVAPAGTTITITAQ